MDRDEQKPKANKSAPKSKSAKKRKSDGPTCSMFLSELSRKLALKKRQEEEAPKNIVQTIIESITNALPVRFSKRNSPKKIDSPLRIESLAPELLPNTTIDIPSSHVELLRKANDIKINEVMETDTTEMPGFKILKMPLTDSDVFKTNPEVPKKAVAVEDVSVNTKGEHDVAEDIAKHVDTLRKISLIAEEFNQKTAKNLKEIIDSVREDLIKKLEELKEEKKSSLENHPVQEIAM